MSVRILGVLVVLVALVSGCSSHSSDGGTASGDGWVDDEVTFDSDGLTLHGTFRHQQGAQTAPTALLISEAGRTDRNGDNAVAGPVGNMRQLAEFLSQHGVASLRYDKIGTGATGLGPYQNKPAEVGSTVYTAGAKAAWKFLAAQPGVDKAKLSVYGLGDGATHAMALATDTDPAAPKVHALGLLQPLPGRYLDLISNRVRTDANAAVKEGGKTQEQADGVIAAWTAAVAQARSTGTVPQGNLPDGLSAILNPGNVKAVVEADAVDPLAEAAKVPPGTPVLLTCSDSDGQSNCADIQPMAGALGQTKLTLLQLKGVNHVLRNDPSDNVANYAKQDPLSDQLTGALEKFLTE